MKKADTIGEEKNQGLVNKIIFQYGPYWPLFLVLFILAGTGAWLYMQYATPMYESTARILIKDEKKGTEDSKTLEALNALSSKKIIENEMEVIQSRTLLNDVIKNLGLYARVYVDGRLKATPVYVNAPLVVKALYPDSIISASKLYFKPGKKGFIEIAGQQYPVGQWVLTPFGVLKFSLNERFSWTAGKKLYLKLDNPKQVTTALQRNLKVNSASKQSSILNLALLDENPERSEDILNSLLFAYNKAIINDKNTLAANTLEFVEERLKDVEFELDSIERKVQTYRARTGAIDVSTQGRLFLENVSLNDQRAGELNMQMAVLNQVRGYVQSKERNTGIVPSTLGITDPTLSQLVEKLYNAELEYEKLKKTTAENNPLLVSVTDQIEKIKPSILENVENQQHSVLASLNNVAATNRQYTTALQSFPEKEKELIDINRQQSIKSGIYTFLLQKREETALSYASTVPDSRVIDKAQSSGTPVSPKSKVVYLAAFLAALLLGMGIVVGRETFSRKIMFRHEIEKLTSIPVIGEICAGQGRDLLVINTDKRTFIAQQFRKLRGTLTYLGINPTRKRILVTSAISGEGKSFIAANIALSLAMTGKKVILLDFDLNNPTLGGKLKSSGSAGISEYLQGNKEPDEIVSKTDIHPDLYLAPAGELPDDPSELIMNGRAEYLLTYLDSIFDYIVIDSAPVAPVSDAYVLSPLCDATLYVIRHKYTPKVFVERLDAENKINHLHNAAIIFNGVTPRGFGNKNYGYGYGYGYIYHNNEKKRVKRLPS